MIDVDSYSILKKHLESSLSVKTEIHDIKVLKYWASVHLVLAQNQDSWQVAMIRRAICENDPWSGHYAFPGGSVEKNEDFSTAALRETSEEVGLNVKAHEYMGEFYRFQLKYNEKVMKLGISAHVSLLEQGSSKSFRPDPSEVDEAFWFNLKDLLNPENIEMRNFESALLNSKVKYPSIGFDGHMIWGISYRVLYHLVELLEGFEYSEGNYFNSSLLPRR